MGRGLPVLSVSRSLTSSLFSKENVRFLASQLLSGLERVAKWTHALMADGNPMMVALTAGVGDEQVASSVAVFRKVALFSSPSISLSVSLFFLTTSLVLPFSHAVHVLAFSLLCLLVCVSLIPPSS